MNVIKEYIRALLKEAAIQDISNLGLLIHSPGSVLDIVLYDAPRFIEETKKNKSLTFSNDMILGMIKAKKSGFGKCHGAWEVAMVAANKGFGPTMYDIAMMSVPTKTIMPDRGEVSGQARAIWQYYKNKRSDVKVLPFGKEEEDDTSSKSLYNFDDDMANIKEDKGGEGDCFSAHFGAGKEYLDAAYRLVGPPPIDISQAVNKHNLLVKSLNEKKPGLGDSFSDSLRNGSTSFFTSKNTR
jgi:hypothetical protein